jgi:hypothetical protein
MTFEEILDQAIAMLRRLGLVTYRTLKRQFDLDDEALEDLKDQLLFSHPVVDQDGRGLVWTGETEPQPELDAQRGTEDERRFQALLPAVIALLRQEGRVTYRTLKWTFAVEDALLGNIREELTFRQLARDENDKGMVWSGATQTIAPSGMDVSIQPVTEETPVIPSPEVSTSPHVTELPSDGPTVATETISTDTSYRRRLPFHPSQPSVPLRPNAAS